ncbi:DUF2878 family protein [Candidatus Micrarchaeota archaeon]|nr:DUF2878 family protein [Candidatus Micrarchaeota archaeon]
MRIVYKSVTYSILAFGSLVLVSFLWKSPFLLTLLLLFTASLMIVVSKNLEDILLFIVGGMFGVVSEAFAISQGAWSYPLPFAFGVPLWLFCIWGIAALYINKLYKGICEFGFKRKLPSS